VHGHCTDAAGTAVCACDVGHAGEGCTACAAGFQDNDGNGACESACGANGWDCSGRGTCGDSTGHPACTCPPGYFSDGRGACPVPDGRSCPGALTLDLAAGTLHGDTTGASDLAHGSCQTHSSAEIVWRLEVPERLRLRVRAQGFDTVLYLRSACDDARSEAACDDDLSASDHGSLLDAVVDAGTWFLFVDGAAGQWGAYTLEVGAICPDGRLWDPAQRACVANPCASGPCLEPGRGTCEPVPPSGHVCLCSPGFLDQSGSCVPDPAADGDGCSRAMALTGTEGTLQGTTSDTTSHGTGTCGGTGPDRVYAFTTGVRSRLQVSMNGYDTVLHLRSACDPSAQILCNDDAGGEGAGLDTAVDPGSYYVFADSYGAGGSYTLSWSLRADPCAQDPCPGAPECEALPDWSSFRCTCPAGSIPSAEACVDDPCIPNPCAAVPHQSRCTAALPQGTAVCGCDLGYLDDGAGGCALDPAANEWVFVEFLNGDNNLEANAYGDLDEMTRAGSSPYVHVVVLMDSDARDAGHARRIYVRQGSAEVVQDMGELDMSDGRVLRDFVVWALQTYPARHRALVLWDHGDGWRIQAPGHPVVKGFSTDDHGGSGDISIASGEFGQALAGIVAVLGDKLDLLAFDACLMGMWEVADAAAPYARVFVASEDTVPSTGFPYEALLGPFVASTGTTAAQLGAAMADTYHDASADNVTLSAVDLDAQPALDAAVSAFADALLAHPEVFDKVETARAASLAFDDPESVDLGDFAHRVAAMTSCPADLAAAANALEAQLGRSVLHNRARAPRAPATGLAIYLPGRGERMDRAYSSGVWSAATHWDEFLAAFAR